MTISNIMLGDLMVIVGIFHTLLLYIYGISVFSSAILPCGSSVFGNAWQAIAHKKKRLE
jgi:hypothetical protein